MFITICSTLVASPFIFLCIQSKCGKEFNQHVTKFFKRSQQKKCCVMEMVPISSGTKPYLNAKIQKAPEEKGIHLRAYEKHLRGNTAMPSSLPSIMFYPLCHTQEEDIHHWISNTRKHNILSAEQ